MLVQPSYVSSNLLCLSHPLMLGLTQSGTNMGQTLHYNFIYRILLLFINQKLSIEFVHIIMHLDPNTCLSIQGAKSKQSLRIKKKNFFAVQLGYSDS